MSDRNRTEQKASAAPAGENPLRRWSRRKHEARRSSPVDASPPSAAVPPPQAPAAQPDTPPLEALDADSDYSGFLAPQVDEALQRLALRKLFHSAKFNVIDGLDDYAEDYRCFEELGHAVAAELTDRLRGATRQQTTADIADDDATPLSDETSDDAPAAKDVPAARQEPDGDEEHDA